MIFLHELLKKYGFNDELLHEVQLVDEDEHSRHDESQLTHILLNDICAE